ncbi:hypothetical protein BY996DRAFT_6417094 [Phakopsora pachyrhizi]|nr:hypothetical protein BY996DRAFT_6417094 [Phakopsora pachyrhizi]
MIDLPSPPNQSPHHQTLLYKHSWFTSLLFDQLFFNVPYLQSNPHLCSLQPLALFNGNKRPWMEVSYVIQANGQAEGTGNVSVSCEASTVEDQFRDPETSVDGDQISSGVNGQPRDPANQFSNVAERSNLVSWTPVTFEHSPRNTLFN